MDRMMRAMMVLLALGATSCGRSGEPPDEPHAVTSDAAPRHADAAARPSAPEAPPADPATWPQLSTVGGDNVFGIKAYLEDPDAPFLQGNDAFDEQVRLGLGGESHLLRRPSPLPDAALQLEHSTHKFSGDGLQLRLEIGDLVGRTIWDESEDEEGHVECIFDTTMHLSGMGREPMVVRARLSLYSGGRATCRDVPIKEMSMP